jgi:pimeloyl-ACP methyl ester carboxylesterase
LIGTAAGGFVALDFAISHPERLRSFTLLCSQAGVQNSDFMEAVKRLAPDGFRNMPPDFRELALSYRVANPGGVARWSEFENMRPKLYKVRSAHQKPRRVGFDRRNQNSHAGDRG